MAASVNPASGKRRPLIEFDLAENIRSAIASEPTSADSEWAGGNAMIRDAPIALDNLVEFDEDAAAMLEAYNAPEELPASYIEQKRDEQRNESIFKKVKTRIPYYIPILSWLPKYNVKEDLVKDIVAGLGVSAMLIPQSLAYAILAGLPPNIGLYTAFFPVIIYFLLGTSKQLSLGPDALSSLLIGIILAGKVKNGEEAELVVTAISFMVGLVCLGLGLLRVGFLDNVLSRPLLCGFVNAVAVTIIFEQSDVFFGLPARGKHGWEKVVTSFQDIAEINWPTVIMGLVTCAILVANRILKKRFVAFKYIPETLVVVVIGIIFSAIFNVTTWGVKVIGNMKSGFEVPAVPPLSALEANNGFFLESAVLVAVVGFIEHIVIAKLYAAKYNYQISPNRELVALGVSNFVGSFFHTFPTFGSLPRSALADSLGAKTELFSLVSAGVILISILFLGPIFSLLPRIVMSSIILVAAIGLFELHDIAFLFRIRAWRDLFLLALTFVLTVVLGIELGIGISLIISVFLIIRHTTFPFVSILGRVKDTQSYTEVSQVDAQLLPGILIVRIEEPLYFANIAQIKRLFVRIERLGDPKAHPGERTKDLPRVRAVIIHARNIISMDASAIQTVEEMVHDYHNRNVLVCWVKLRQILKERFIRVGLLDPMRMNEQVFEKVSDAVTYAEDYVAKYREEDAKMASASVVYDDDILQDEGLRQVNNHHV